jgi:pilus assembly protein CpaB
MRNRSLILLAVAITCGLIASVGITRALSKRTHSAEGNTVPTVPIVVAAADIPVGSVITAEMIRTEPWPRPKIPLGAQTNPEEVVGRRPKTRIYANTPILENQLLARGDRAVDPTEHIPPGYRVVSVQVDEVIGAGRLIRPGDRVDLLVFIQRNPQRGIPETITRTVLQDVRVFAVGDQFDLEDVENKRSIAARSVSLLVTPRQAEMLMLATELGSIRLSLRSYADDSVVDLPGSSPRDLGAAPLESPPSLPGSGLLVGVGPAPGPSTASQQTATPEGEQSDSPQPTWTLRLIEGSKVRQLQMVALSSDTAPNNPKGVWAWQVREETSQAENDEASGLVLKTESKPADSGENKTETSGSSDQIVSQPDDGSPQELGLL